MSNPPPVGARGASTMAMTPKQRLLAAIMRQQPDRLPVTTHHLMPFFLDGQMGGMGFQAFFDEFGLDAITWINPHRPDPAAGEYYDPLQGDAGVPGGEAGLVGHVAGTPRGDPGPALQDGALPLHHAQGHAVDGAAVKRAHELGGRVPDQGEARYRPDRRVRYGAQVRGRGGERSGGRVRRARDRAQPCLLL